MIKLKFLEKKAKDLRIQTLQQFVKKGEAHLGGSFSCIEILVSLYEVILKKTDKFIMSKSHASFPLCLLLKSKGLDPKITTHLEIDLKNGINCTTGSLGHGLPISTGMAKSYKIRKTSGNIFVLISDGECQEGTTWESLLIANKHKLDNLILIVDYNKIQALSNLEDVLPLDNLKKKFEAFNCDVFNISNGHNFNEIITKFKKIKKNKKTKVFIVNTIKGKGIKEFENDPVWHARKLEEHDIAIAKKRLGF